MCRGRKAGIWLGQLRGPVIIKRVTVIVWVLKDAYPSEKSSALTLHNNSFIFTNA